MTVYDTPRLTIETLTRAHAADLADALLDARVYTYIAGDYPNTVDALADKFEKMAAGAPPHFVNETWLNFAVRVRETGVAIGVLESTVIEDRAEIGYMFGPAYWGQGYASEALTWLHAHVREHFSISAFWATVMPGNDRSAGVLRKFGYREYFGELPMLTTYDPGDWVFVNDDVGRQSA
jgi:[ribosomal protein S5]-alanine N-acetyltransferase